MHYTRRKRWPFLHERRHTPAEHAPKQALAGVTPPGLRNARTEPTCTRHTRPLPIARAARAPRPRAPAKLASPLTDVRHVRRLPSRIGGQVSHLRRVWCTCDAVGEQMCGRSPPRASCEAPPGGGGAFCNHNSKPTTPLATPAAAM